MLTYADVMLTYADVCSLGMGSGGGGGRGGGSILDQKGYIGSNVGNMGNVGNISNIINFQSMAAGMHIRGAFGELSGTPVRSLLALLVQILAALLVEILHIRGSVGELSGTQVRSSLALLVQKYNYCQSIYVWLLACTFEEPLASYLAPTYPVYLLALSLLLYWFKVWLWACIYDEPLASYLAPRYSVYWLY